MEYPKNMKQRAFVRKFNVSEATLYAWRQSALKAGVVEAAAGLLTLKRLPRRLRGGRMISTEDRRGAVRLIDEAVGGGAGLFKACAGLCVCSRTYRRLTVARGVVKTDGHPNVAGPTPANARTEAERQALVVHKSRLAEGPLGHEIWPMAQHRVLSFRIESRHLDSAPQRC